MMASLSLQRVCWASRPRGGRRDPQCPLWALKDGASVHRQKLVREALPERALRMPIEKAQKLRAEAAKGQRVCIGARVLGVPSQGTRTATELTVARASDVLCGCVPPVWPCVARRTLVCCQEAGAR